MAADAIMVGVVLDCMAADANVALDCMAADANNVALDRLDD